MEAEEQKLKSALRSDMFLTENVFDDYMRARYSLIEALREIDTRISVETQLQHAIDMLRLCQSNNMGFRDIAPGLMLRLR